MNSSAAATNNVVIASAVRTPIGSFNGMFKEVTAIRLGSIAIAEAISRAGIDAKQVDEVIMGNVLQAGLGQNPARQAALAAGLSVDIPALTINHVCGSGMKAVSMAYNAIRSGDCEIIVAGGMENMSLAPYLLQGARSGYRMGHQTMVDTMIQDGLWCAANNYHMGMTAENIGDHYGFTRQQLDQFAWQSQQKAKAAVDAGRFDDELISVSIPQKKGEALLVTKDEYPRPDTTLEALARLRPAFKHDGIVTAGNASGINDGAAALVILSERRAVSLGLKPLAILRSHASAGVEPSMMGIGPIPATERALAKAGLAMNEIDLLEVNEAFAAQALAYGKHFDYDPGIFNVNGGAIALGHPIGASGARVLVTLLHEMRRQSSRLGLASLCIGGGQGIATIVEGA
ncbi:acetyl-CoA C-acetyltransferase [Paenibacillus mendelii]|uniref:acetyl-CoA C-acetyltransferase n=1 Tax=Paenibacillus mendelii TaxID=206163 RepID=A0ABV6JEW9_9BACL|nr:acetyl-CoA C-acetyltransferase [Paenibacillus mendelii]MCQ6557337.1 acetyl-CoA C-acetyltransferase [Paenibacillus mendelii]